MIFSAVAVMGFGCSFGCGTITTPFILGSLLGEGNSIHNSRKSMVLFSLGKVVALAVMGLLASLLGATLLSSLEEIYPQSTAWLMRGVTLLFGAWLLYAVFFQKSCKDTGCGACSSHISPTRIPLRKGFYMGAGALYATIPCVPLLTTLGYASALPPALAMLLLAVFGVVNSIVPTLGYASLVGLANAEFAQKTPLFVKYIRAIGGCVLIFSATLGGYF